MSRPPDPALPVALLAALLAAALTACGGAAPRPAMMADAAERWIAVEETAAGSASVSKAAPSPIYDKKSIAESSPIPDDEPDTKGMAERQVVYLGFLRLRVRRLLDAVDALTERVAQAGGYVESLSKTVMVVRVPAGDFDAAMTRLAEVGEVIARRVKALDVTAQFLDIEGRLAVARETRDRLLGLLEQTPNTDERLRILQEIKRLTEQIESMESRLSTLRNLVDYYTITIELEPVAGGRRAQVHRSPFVWIRSLRAHDAALPPTDDVKLAVPDGFVRLDEADGWEARAADTSALRVSEVDNEPAGDAPWWAAAVKHELEGRDEAIVAEGSAGGLSWLIAAEKDVQPRAWLVGVATHGDRLLVVEAFFPDTEALERHRKAVLAALDGFRVE